MVWWQDLPRPITWLGRCSIEPCTITTIAVPNLLCRSLLAISKCLLKARQIKLCTDSASLPWSCFIRLAVSKSISSLPKVASWLLRGPLLSVCVLVGNPCVFGISTVKHARDLGVHVSFGHRSIPIAKNRAKRAAMRAKRIRGLAKKRARVSRLLFGGGALPRSTYGHQIRGIAPINMKRLRAVAARTTGGCRAGMCTTTLLATTQTEQASRLYAEVIGNYHVLLRDHPLLTKRIERAWPRLRRRFVKAPVKGRCFQVTGFLWNVIAVLLELEWQPLGAKLWINDLGEEWTFSHAQIFDLVPVVKDIERAAARSLWKAASMHRHGESLAHASPDLTVLRRHLHCLRKRGFIDRATMLQLAACGGFWTEQRRQEAWLRDHATCPRCDAGVIENEATSLATLRLSTLLPRQMGFCLKPKKVSKNTVLLSFYL